MKPLYNSNTQQLMLDLVHEHYKFLTSDDNKEVVEYWKKSMAPLYFAEQFRTLALRTYRGIGHSRVAELLFSIYFPSILVAPKHMMVERLQRELPKNFPEWQSTEARKIIHDWILPVSEFSRVDVPRPLKGRNPPPFKLCIVDTASYLTDEERERLYVHLSPHVTLFTFLE